MFQRARSVIIPRLRHCSFHSLRWNGATTMTVISAALVGSVLWYSEPRTIYNDTGPRPRPTDKLKTLLVEKPEDSDTIYSLVWGTNKNQTIMPDLPSEDTLRTPTVAQWLNGVALRDLQFHETHAACVDSRGDIYQWGFGFFGEKECAPKLTLRGKNIVHVQLTDEKLYALSASGKIYVLCTNRKQQILRPGAPTPASDSWWGTGWLWGEDETVDFAEVAASESLGWGESFVSMVAGTNHLLVLTSKGRVFAHPVNKKANQYGQLGFRKFVVPDSAAAINRKDSHIAVELIPKSLADPFVNATRAIRAEPAKLTSDNLTDIDDSNIRWCPYLFEIPILRGVDVAQIAAGGRSSFVRTPTGRVLGWGANEYGQIGLGSNVVLPTITVPTEVVLWRFTPTNQSTKCQSVTAAGDLTAFIVERGEGNEQTPKIIDLLICGNGQYGALGNNSYSNAQGNPSKVKGISGLLQYNDRTRQLEAIQPRDLSVSPTGHVLLALDSSADLNGVGGSDLMVWGKNQASELGNGRKANLVVPTAMETAEGDRYMLKTRNAKKVLDLHGKVWRRGVKVEQRVVAGYENSAVYWKII